MIIEQEKLDRVIAGFNQILLTRKEVAEDVPINYVTLTKLLNKQVGIAQINYDKCVEYLKGRGIEV